MLAFLLLACTPIPPPLFGGGGASPLADGDPCTVVAPSAGFDPMARVAEPHANIYGAAPRPFHVHLGLPLSDASRSLSVLWRTDTDTQASLIQIGPASSFPEDAAIYHGASFLFGAGEANRGDLRQHEVRLCDRLLADTVYRYRVGGPGSWSEIYETHTPPAPSADGHVRVAIVGDSRGNYDTWGAVLGLIDAEEPDLILHSGDFVEVGAVQAEWDDWFAASGDVLARRPLYPAHGNHEYLAQNYFAQLGLPGNEQWYTVRSGPLQIVSLNDTVANESQLRAQSTFLRDTFAATDAPWRIAFHHQATWSVCTAHGSNEALRALWGPQFEAAGVQIVASGHNHIYERSAPLVGETVVGEGEGPVYLVSGGAGAPLYTETDPQPWSLVQATEEHFIIADLGPTEAEVVVRDLSGDVLDSFTVPR